MGLSTRDVSACFCNVRYAPGTQLRLRQRSVCLPRRQETQEDCKWIGQETAHGMLSELLEQGPPDRLLFTGPEGTGKSYLAKWFLIQLRKRGAIKRFKIFDGRSRQSDTRDGIRNAKQQRPESEPSEAFAVSASLLSNPRVLKAALEPAASPILEIFMTENDDGVFLNELNGYRVPFFPLLDQECADVLRLLGFGDIADDEIAVAASRGCFELAAAVHDYTSRVSEKVDRRTWKLLRDVPSIRAEAQRIAHKTTDPDIDGDESSLRDPLTVGARPSVKEIVEICRVIVGTQRNLKSQITLLHILDHLWAHDMERSSMALDVEGKDSIFDLGWTAHLALVDAEEKLNAGIDPELVWNVALLTAARPAF